MKYTYYKNLLLAYAHSAEFSEHQQKHLMSHEDTRRTVDEDLRHERIGRFLSSEENMRILLEYIINTDMAVITDFCRLMTRAKVGEYVKKDYNIGPLPNTVGIQYNRNGEEECHYFHLTFSYKKGWTEEFDRARIVTFFPAAQPN